MAEIREYKTVSYEGLTDEIDNLIESDRFSHSVKAIEALESVKWWAMEEIVPSVNDAYDVDVRLSENEMKVIINELKPSIEEYKHDISNGWQLTAEEKLEAETKMKIVEKLLRHIEE